MRIVPRLLLGVVVVVALSTAAVHALSVASTTDTVAATVAKILHVESSSSPEKNQQRIPTQSQAKPNSVAPAAVQSSLGPNLIANPSLETTNASGLPSAWNKGGYGTNNRAFSYPVAGTGGAATKAAKLSITSYTSGDAKWFPDDVPVTAGATYQFSDQSLANAPSIIDVRYMRSDGTFIYTDIASVPASAAFQTNTTQFVVPANVVSLTFFHLLNSAGTLTVDDYSLKQVQTGGGSSNIIPNPDFETAGSNGNPASWARGGYGTNNRAFTYPVTGVGGGKAAKVAITSYTNGDAKWYFTPISAAPGVYTFTDQYLSTVTSRLTAQITHTGGAITYSDFGTLPPSSTFTAGSGVFTVPQDAQSVTIFHLIQAAGALTIDNASASLSTTSGGGVFQTGGVTLRFDDEWLSQYQNALPKLQSSGFKGSFYIVSRQTADDGYPDFMSKAQIADLFSKGHEIGAHTKTHADLPTLTLAQQQDEVAGGRQDLISWGTVGPVNSFAYPYGDYDATTLQVVKDAGFSSALSTNDGDVTPSSDKFQLERKGVTVGVTVAQVKSWIDTAVANKEWLILAFHKIDTSGEQYSTTPANFNAIVDYLKQKNVPVITVAQGVAALQ